MIIRCQLCNTPLFELTIREKDVIIIVKGKHHGEWHKSLIRIEDLIAKMREELPDDPGNHMVIYKIEYGGHASRRTWKYFATRELAERHLPLCPAGMDQWKRIIEISVIEESPDDSKV